MYILFQNIWSNLKKEPLVSLLFILQIAITSFIIYSTSFEYKYSTNQLDMVNTAHEDYSYYYLFHSNMSAFENPGEWYEAFDVSGFPIRLDEAIEQIRNKDGVRLVVNNQNINFKVKDLCLHFDEEDRTGPLAILSYIGEDYSTFRACMIDKAFFDMFPIRMDSGRFFTDEDFKLTYEKKRGKIK